MRERLYVRVRKRDDADEIAQLVFTRFWEELTRGKQYVAVPCRGLGTSWTGLRRYYSGASPEVSLPEDWDPPDESDDALERWAAEHDVRLLFADLAQGERDVAELIYVEQVSHEQAAARLGITRNAVDQRLHRANRKLAERLLV